MCPSPQLSGGGLLTPPPNPGVEIGGSLRLQLLPVGGGAVAGLELRRRVGHLET